VGAAAAEGVAKLSFSEEEIAAEKKNYPKPKEEPSKGVVESFKTMGHQIVDHPLDSLKGLALGLAADPELLFPGLWETAPAKLVTSIAKTSAKAAAVGAIAESTAGLAEGSVNPQKVADTAIMFGLFGGVTQGALGGAKSVLHNPSPGAIKADIALNKLLGGDNETISARVGKSTHPVAKVAAYSLDKLDPGHIERALADVRKELGTSNEPTSKSGVWETLKGTVIKDAPKANPLDPDFQKSKMRPDETISEAIARNKENKHIAQAALRNKETGEIVPQGAKHDDKLKAQQDISFYPKEEKEDPLFKEAVNVFTKVHFDEKTSDPKNWTKEENAAWDSKDWKKFSRIRGYTEEEISNYQRSIELADKLDSKYGEGYSQELVHLLSFDKKEGGHTLEQDSSKYAQGFIDNEGKFLNRKEALERAKETKQLDPQHKLDFPEEGLHSGDLRASGVRDFQTSVHPDEAKVIGDNALAKVDKEVKDSINKDNQDHQQTLTAAADTIGLALGAIQALTRRAAIWGRTIKSLIPDEGIRSRVTRAMESEKGYDKIYTDKEKHDILYGTGEDILDDRTGRPSGRKEEGMTGALRGMDNLIERGQTPHSFKGTLEEYIAKRDKFKMVVEKFKSLPSEEHAIPVMKQIQERMKDIGDRATAAGLITQLRNNYVTHILDFSKTKMNAKEQQALLDKIYNTPKDSKLVKDFTEHRKYEFLRTLEGLVAGTGVVVHTDIAIIAEAYEKSMLEAIIHKQMIDHFTELKAPNGLGFIQPLSEEGLKAGYVSFQGKGSSALQGLIVHPDLVDTMGFMFNQTNPDLILRSLGAITMLTKTLNTVASLFHATNLGIAGATADPALALKEIFTGGSGLRAAAEAFKNGGKSSINIAGKDYAMESLINSFMEQGLMAGSEDIKRTIVADMGVKVDRLLSKFVPIDKEVRAVQHLTEPFDKHILQKLNGFTWDYMHTGQKLNLAINRFAKAKAKNPTIPDEQLMKEVSRFVNNTFGGLNWIDVANQTQNQYLKAFAMKAANMRGRAWGQVLLFAPDWTVSTLRSMTTALPKELFKPQNWKLREGVKGMYNPVTQGDFARRYVLNTAIGYLTIQNGINIALSGHPIWENKDPTRVDNGDGTTTQVAKHSMETAEWVRDPMKTLGNKLGFFPKAVYVELSGRAYPSPDAPKLKPVYHGYGGMELAKAKAIALTASPFQISSGMQAPEGEGLKRGIMSSLGLPTYGMTKEERKAAISKGKADAKIEKERRKWEDVE
jgi:hypothetical protein